MTIYPHVLPSPFKLSYKLYLNLRCGLFLQVARPDLDSSLSNTLLINSLVIISWCYAVIKQRHKTFLQNYRPSWNRMTAHFTVNLSFFFCFKVCLVISGDNSDLSSIKSAASEISELTKKVDCLFMNAGTMGTCSLDLGNVMRSLLAPWELPYRFATGDGLIKYSSGKTSDGKHSINLFKRKISLQVAETHLKQKCISYFETSTCPKLFPRVP